MTAKAPEPAKDSAATTGTTPTVPAAPAASAPTPAAAASAPTPAAAAAAPAPAKAAPRPPAPKARANSSAPKSSAGVAGGAFVVAVCALLVAIGAIAVAIYSLQQAREAISKNADRAAPAAEAPATSTAPAATAPAPTVSTSAPRVTYSPEFVRAPVTLPAPSGCGSVYLDVDTLAVGVQAGHEFYLSDCAPPLALRLDKTSGATSTSSNPSPELCSSMVAGTSTTTELVLQARAGLTFCLLTNKADAVAASLPQRLAIVEVTTVGVDKSVTLAVSTFRVVNP
jgi:hypothetical protein